MKVTLFLRNPSIFWLKQCGKMILYIVFALCPLKINGSQFQYHCRIDSDMRNNVENLANGKDKGSASKRVTVVTGSVAQVPKDIAEQLDIHVVPYILILEGKQFQDGVDLAPQILYKRMRNEALDVKTSAPSVGHYYEVFLDLVRAGSESVLYVCLSSNFSAAFSSANAAAKLVRQEFPDCEIRVVDSKMATASQGFIAIEAARLALDGATLNQVTARAIDVRDKVGLVATLETLEYLRRGGRIGKAAFALGSLVNVKPILSIDGDGAVSPICRVHGTRKALAEIVEFTAEKVAGSHTLRLAVMEADAHEQAAQLERMVVEKLNPDEIFWSTFTPVMGAHTGPGLIGLAYYFE
jgi:DegV family protein with EDD domain